MYATIPEFGLTFCKLVACRLALRAVTEPQMFLASISFCYAWKFLVLVVSVHGIYIYSSALILSHGRDYLP